MMKELISKHWRAAVPFFILCFIASDVSAIRGGDCFSSPCRLKTNDYYTSETNLLLSPSVLIERIIQHPGTTTSLRLRGQVFLLIPTYVQSRTTDLVLTHLDMTTIDTVIVPTLRTVYLSHKFVVLLSVFWWAFLYFLVYKVWKMDKRIGVVLIFYLVYYLGFIILLATPGYPWEGESNITPYFFSPTKTPRDIPSSYNA